jgi:hypothetical protein
MKGSFPVAMLALANVNMTITSISSIASAKRIGVHLLSTCCLTGVSRRATALATAAVVIR